jgi:hypothetical protein
LPTWSVGSNENGLLQASNAAERLQIDDLWGKVANLHESIAGKAKRVYEAMVTIAIAGGGVGVGEAIAVKMCVQVTTTATTATTTATAATTAAATAATATAAVTAPATTAATTQQLQHQRQSQLQPQPQPEPRPQLLHRTQHQHQANVVAVASSWPTRLLRTARVGLLCRPPPLAFYCMSERMNLFECA